MSQRFDLSQIQIHVSYNYTRHIRPLAPIFSPSGAPFTGISIKSRHLSPKSDQLALGERGEDSSGSGHHGNGAPIPCRTERGPARRRLLPADQRRRPMGSGAPGPTARQPPRRS